MSNKKFIKMMDDELVPDNKEKIRMRIGYYETRKKHNYSFVKPAVAFALVLALAFGLFTFFKPHSNPSFSIKGSTYLSIDVNPSIEFVVNDKLIVTTCTPKNKKAKTLLVNTNYVGYHIDDVTESLISKLNTTGYISMTNKNNAILVTAINEDERSQKAVIDKVNNQIGNYFKDNRIYGVVINGDNVINNEIKNEADQNNISVGKMKLINAIIASYDPLDPNKPTINDLKDKKVSELNDIIEQIDDNREEILDDLEDEIEDILELIEDYYEKYCEEEDDDDEDEVSLYVEKSKEEMEQEILDKFNECIAKFGQELLKNIIIDFANLVNTIEQIEAFLDSLDDLDESILDQITSNSDDYKKEEFDNLRLEEIKKINSMTNKDQYYEEFDDDYEDWVKANTTKYEQDWFYEKNNWETNFN